MNDSGMTKCLPVPRFLGVVHLLPLPGAPLYGGSMEAVLEAAKRDASALAQGGAGGIIVENFGDLPFRPGAVDPETVAAMALCIDVVRREVGDGVALGANVLRNDGRSALGLCVATGASFFRVNVHAGAAVTDQGVISGEADQTLRHRTALFPDAAKRPALMADVHVKHATPMGDSEIGLSAQDTFRRAGADALIVSGTGTGAGVDLAELRRVREAVPEAPIWIGSGFTPATAEQLLTFADGAIVGTWIKEAGRLAAPVDPQRVREVAAFFA
ncbi:MAG: membrane complex biogenesis BtpA family protein [Bacteroidia bacterium]|jgi:membrane complex biogenesis BtpA family protein